jgi:hypothetical protein
MKCYCCKIGGHTPTNENLIYHRFYFCSDQFLFAGSIIGPISLASDALFDDTLRHFPSGVVTAFCASMNPYPSNGVQPTPI